MWFSFREFLNGCERLVRTMVIRIDADQTFLYFAIMGAMTKNGENTIKVSSINHCRPRLRYPCRCRRRRRSQLARSGRKNLLS